MSLNEIFFEELERETRTHPQLQSFLADIVGSSIEDRPQDESVVHFSTGSGYGLQLALPALVLFRWAREYLASRRYSKKIDPVQQQIELINMLTEKDKLPLDVATAIVTTCLSQIAKCSENDPAIKKILEITIKISASEEEGSIMTERNIVDRIQGISPEDITILKADGGEMNGVHSWFLQDGAREIIIHYNNVCSQGIDEGDTIVRYLPEGKKDRYFVRDPGYTRQRRVCPSDNFPEHYEIKSERLPTTIKQEAKNEPGNHIITDILVAANSQMDANRVSEGQREIDLFISHSNRDADLAEAFIELLQTACTISDKKIRCSSVEGYKLPIGASTDDHLRHEVNATKLFVGLITPSSIESVYVLFELGARWGAGLHLAPILARGKEQEANLLKGPLSHINALNGTSNADLHQLISEFRNILDAPPVNAAVYQKYIDKVVSLSKSAVKSGST